MLKTWIRTQMQPYTLHNWTQAKSHQHVIAACCLHWTSANYGWILAMLLLYLQCLVVFLVASWPPPSSMKFLTWRSLKYLYIQFASLGVQRIQLLRTVTFSWWTRSLIVHFHVDWWNGCLPLWQPCHCTTSCVGCSLPQWLVSVHCLDYHQLTFCRWIEHIYQQ